MTERDTALPTIDPALREQLVDDICALLPQVLKREVTGATAATTLMEALGMSSTSGLELILELEEHLDVEISVEELGRHDFATVGSLADYVAQNLIPEA
ncbi:phosphopantetheine-binding protein [Kitasatospora sp. NBC_00240]|uniref:phosphopantetheine-binding protein n=1 Tax=Kitasatospora sp. NBC_00240 TaxID=2903567 RepID=UPI00225A2804|nr:phosphopantetheine-binding protein [Kitasatospora sp. NBC_00240]MCX5215066.1 phosphopantetheine-binding protein [Kitasatospora sp. NBC_00240]